MATVQLSDVYVPAPFNAAVDEAATELNAFLASGVAVNDSTIDATASSGGWVGDLAHYKPLSTSNEPNYDSCIGYKPRSARDRNRDYTFSEKRW